MSTYRRRFVPLFIGVLFSLCLINSQATAESQATRTNPPQADPATLPAASSGLEGAEREKVVTQFATVPAFFIENKGQTAKEAKYYFKGNDNVYFTDDGVMFQKIVKESKSLESGVKESAVGAGLPRPHKDGDAEAVEARALAYKLEFIGAKPTPPQARNELKGKVNYLIGNDRSKWHTNIPTYQEIVYPGLYPPMAETGWHGQTCLSVPNVDKTTTPQSPPSQGGDKGEVFVQTPQSEIPTPQLARGGIDLVYKGVPGGMKYEFIVQPGANPDEIRLAYTGIEGLSIDDSGNLIIHTSLGDVKDSKPYCYQEIDGKKVEVRCNFVIMECSDHVAVDTTPYPPFLRGISTVKVPLNKGGLRGLSYTGLQEGRGCLFPLYQQVGSTQAQFPLHQEETKGNGVLFPLYQETVS